MENVEYFLGILCYLQVFLAYYYSYIVFSVRQLPRYGRNKAQ